MQTIHRCIFELILQALGVTNFKRLNTDIPMQVAHEDFHINKVNIVNRTWNCLCFEKFVKFKVKDKQRNNIPLTT